MTLLELANYICTKVNQIDPEDVAACKSFLTRRNDMIWADQLWKDSLFEYTQTLGAVAYVNTDTWLPTKKVLILPAQISHAIAVRTTDRKLNVESSETFYRQDFDIFSSTGLARQFRTLPPVVWQLDAATIVQMGWEAGSGPAEAFTIDYLDASNNVVRNSGSITGEGTESITASTDRIDSFTCVAGEDGISLFDDVGNFLSLAAGDTSLPKRQRIQLFGTVAAGLVVRVLGKVKCPTFTADGDEPALTGVENCLLSFAQADMLQRDEQYSKAQLLQAEGQALLEQLKKVQTVQQAHNKRVVPESGYYDEWNVTGGYLTTLP